MRYFIVLIVHVLAHCTSSAHSENCNDCQLNFTCCQGLCRPCFNCQLYMRQGGPCVCSLSDCGHCLEEYEEVGKTKFSLTLKACRRMSTTEIGTVKCTSDGHCPKNKYCFNSRCVSCFDCRLYHREPSRFPCAKHPSDCGSCIEGYFEPAVTHYSKLKSCTSKTDYIRYKLLPERNFFFVIIIVIVGSGIFTVFFLRRSRKVDFLNRTFAFGRAVTSNISEAERSTSYAPVFPSFSCEEETVFTYIREEGEKSNATAFVESSSETVQVSSLDEDVVNSPNSPINYDNEETIPSSWTPNPSAERRDGGNESSFSGIINLIKETKLTEPAEECNEKSDNVMSHPDSNVEMDETETATQEFHTEEDMTES